MDLGEALRTTGSVRQFRPDPVDDATVAAILETARFAPSGGNRQPWRVAVVKDLALRHRLAQAMGPVWDEYVAATGEGQVPFNAVDYRRPETVHFGRPNPLMDAIDTVPVVLVVAADLGSVAMMDRDLPDRPPITGGGSIYPFCWNLLLAARDRGLGGVMTTFASRVEPALRDDLGVPATCALAATIFLGVPEHQPTKLRRDPVAAFATIDRFDGTPFG